MGAVAFWVSENKATAETHVRIGHPICGIRLRNAHDNVNVILGKGGVYRRTDIHQFELQAQFVSKGSRDIDIDANDAARRLCSIGALDALRPRATCRKT